MYFMNNLFSLLLLFSVANLLPIKMYEGEGKKHKEGTLRERLETWVVAADKVLDYFMLS